MQRRTIAARAIVDAARPGTRQRQEFGHRTRCQRRVYRQHQRAFGNDGQWCEVAKAVRHLVVERGVDGIGHGRQHQGMAIGFGACCKFGGDIAATAGAVLDHALL